MTVPSSYSIVTMTLIVKFLICRLEGEVPSHLSIGGQHKMLGGAPGFSTPQLPRPGQKIPLKSSLKIEK